MPAAAAVQSTQSVFNAMIPPEGPKALKVVLDFTGGSFNGLVDLTQQTGPSPSGKLSFVQGLYVDNGDSAVALQIFCQSTGQRITVQPGSQAYIPVLAGVPPIFTFNGAANASPNCLVTVFFLNVPLPALEVGPGSIAGFSFAGSNLLVQDTAAEGSLAALTALISGGGLGVNVISGGAGGGGFQGPLTWNAGTFGGATTSHTLYTPASGKKFYINNICITVDPNVSDGAGTLKTFTLQDGGTTIFSTKLWVPSAPAVPTVPVSPILVFSADDMGLKSLTVNNTLLAVTNAGIIGNWYINFSTVIGDVT